MRLALRRVRTGHEDIRGHLDLEEIVERTGAYGGWDADPNARGGCAAAVGRAREAAGDGDVQVAGGAGVVRQSYELGLLDELQIHVAPIVLGGGAHATQVRYRVTRR